MPTPRLQEPGARRPVRTGGGPPDQPNPFAEKLRHEVDGATVTKGLKEDTLQDVVLDLRTPDVFAKGHVPGAVHVPAGALDDVVRAYPRDQPLITMCYHIGCLLSTKAAARLVDLGYTRVRELRGGWQTWEERGYPVERAPEADDPGPQGASPRG